MFLQDIILTSGSVILLLALFPTLLAKEKPAPTTSLLTFSVLAVFSLVYLSLSLNFAATSAALTSACWFVLFLQAKGLLRKDTTSISE
jgi:hypothetical protein